MVDRGVAHRLLGLLREYLQDLKPLQGLSFQEYQSDVRTRRFAERTLQIAIEACLDLGHHLIADEGWREPRDNRDVLAVLAEHGVIDRELLPDLQDMASFRNLIVHNYGTIDHAIVHGIVRRRLGDLERFAAAVFRYLEP